MKRLYRAVPAVFLCFACGSGADDGSKQAAANADVVRRLLHELWVQQNSSVMRELLLPTYRYHYNDLNGVGESLEQARSGIEKDFQEYSDITIPIVDLFTTRDRGALQWIWRARHNETQRHIEIQSNTVYRFKEGRIAEAWDAYDYTGVAVQLGYRLVPEN